LCYNLQHTHACASFVDESPMTQKAIQTRVSPEVGQAFKALAEEHGTSETRFLRLIIQRVLKTQPAVDVTTVEKQDGKRVQINVGLRSDEATMVVEAATTVGLTRVEWIVKLIRAHLLRQPQVTAVEVDALMESNRQLAAVGRNLNQIAKTLNLDPNASYQVTVDSIQKLAADIKAHRKVVSDLLDSNLNRWGVGSGK